METRGRCWRPARRPPILTEMSLSSEEDLSVLRRLREKYNYRIPDNRNAAGPTSSLRAAPVVTDFQVKQEPVTPCESPFLIYRQNVQTGHIDEQDNWTNIHALDQLVQDKIKKEDSLHSFTHQKEHQQPSTNDFPREKENDERMTAQLPTQTSGLRTKRHFPLHDPGDGDSSGSLMNRTDFLSQGNPSIISQTRGAHCTMQTAPALTMFMSKQRETYGPRPHDKSRSSDLRNTLPEFGNCIEGPAGYMTSQYHAENTDNMNVFHPAALNPENKRESAQKPERGRKAETDTKVSPSGFGEMSNFLDGHMFSRACFAVQQSNCTSNQRKHDEIWSGSELSKPEKSVFETQSTPQRSDASWSSASASVNTQATSSATVPVFLTPNEPISKRQKSLLASAQVAKDVILQPLAENAPKSVSATTFRTPEMILQTRKAAASPFQRLEERSTEEQTSRKGKERTSVRSPLDYKAARDGDSDRMSTASRESRQGISEGVERKQKAEEKRSKTSRDRIKEKLKAFPERAKSNSSDKAHVKADREVSGTESDPHPQHVQDISALTDEQRQLLASWLTTCRGTVSLLVSYEDTSTNTDSSVLRRPKERGIFLKCDKGTYLLPAPECCDAKVFQSARSIIKALLANDRLLKVAVNCKHLVITLLKEFSLGDNRGTLGWRFEDPIIAGWLLNPDCPPSTLHALCKIAGINHVQDTGAHDDLALAATVMERLRPRLVSEGVWSLFHHVEMPLTPLLAAMELQPIRVNSEAFVTFSAVLKKKLEKVERKAYELAGHTFCINSTQQLRQLLYEELKLDQQLPGSKKVTLTAATHHKSTSEPMLRQLTSVHPLPSVVLEHRHLVKLKSTYVDGMLEAMEGGALHTHWDQTAAATGRLASSQPNLQAIPKTPTTITHFENNFIVDSEPKSYDIYAREPFICNEGNVFLAADFQQIELRLLAHLTNDDGLKDMFRSDDKSADVFIKLTSRWLLKASADITHAEREQTKRVVYSILYGVGKERLAEYLKVTSSRASDIMDSFLVTFPAIQVFTKKCITYAKQHGYTETVMGRRRWFPNVHHKAAQARAQAERQAVNFCVQGSAADLCKRAMLRVEEALRDKPHLSARLLIHIHDELLWELPQDQLKETRELIKQVMEDDALLCQPMLSSLRVHVTVSISTGTSWAHLTPCV
ncbi:DNA polymerase nu-like [Littorina saxatilis]|uniref:DNA-directed DNA polymerase family A palm domain-containing protein n=1 Tax=Littorina saxatilis TaxID=31220 RepID=A0AAN9BQT2_9CAEN